MRFIPRAIQPSRAGGGPQLPRRRADRPAPDRKDHPAAPLFPRAAYVLLEDPDIQARARSDPRALLEELRTPAVFDEIQNVPELLAYVRTLIDQDPRKMGQWLFTGSQEAPLMQGVSESMAGRAAILPLLPFSLVGDESSQPSSRRLPGGAGASRGPRLVVQFLHPNVPGTGCPRRHERSRPGHLPALPCPGRQPARADSRTRPTWPRRSASPFRP